MVGRKEEKRFLQSLAKEEESQFVAVFGRRRIGKTYLIRESFNYEFTFQHTGISNDSIKEENRKKVQLDKFAESLSASGYDCHGNLSSWNDAFNALKELIANSKPGKKVIFIDELSWMDTWGSGLISALESFWNGWATARKEKDIVLIVCASATYWMMSNIVNARGGLHNRLTGQIHLKQFSLSECEEYLKSKNIVLNRHQILQYYMVLGGVPYYWSLLQKGKSLAQNIDELFFKDGAPLQNEYENLYKALFNKPEQYVAIIEALSSANKGISRDELCRITEIPSSGDMSKKLMELENCDFIRKYIPFGYKSRNCLYQLIDNYTLFYFKFMKNSTFDEKFWENGNNQGKINAWCGIAFERVCLEHIAQIKNALGISGVQTDVNSWQCDSNPDEGIFGPRSIFLLPEKIRLSISAR